MILNENMSIREKGMYSLESTIAIYMKSNTEKSQIFIQIFSLTSDEILFLFNVRPSYFFGLN